MISGRKVPGIRAVDDRDTMAQIRQYKFVYHPRGNGQTFEIGLCTIFAHCLLFNLRFFICELFVYKTIQQDKYFECFYVFFVRMFCV